MLYPKVFLAIDNCFAYRRWTRPYDWSKVIKDLGINYIEASADTEMDPFFMNRDYLIDWIAEVKRVEKEIGVKVKNLYTGHGSYTTIGLAHTDKRVRRHIIDKWFKVLIDIAYELNAGLGFNAHAFPDFVLQDKNLYDKYLDELYDSLAELCNYSNCKNLKKIGVEQMYSPHLVPWRINDTKELLKEVKKRSSDFYFTEDVGHHNIKFLKPNKKTIEKALNDFKNNGFYYNLWLGTKKAYELFEEARNKSKHSKNILIECIIDEMNRNPQMFSKKDDGDCYKWLRELGCYSPIIHLQQTDGLNSKHWPFTETFNLNGIIKPSIVLKELKKSYEKEAEKEMPKKIDKIYLTIEIFTPTASINRDLIEDLKNSVNYWREYIPEDGMRLDETLKY